MNNYLDFEKPIAELEGKIRELRALVEAGNADIADELARLEAKAESQLDAIYGKLTPWQKTLVARHQDRPHFADYVAQLIEDFTPLAGDRAFADDAAIGGGLGRFRGRTVMVIGHEKGRGTDGRVKHNFGMARPEGYRKAIRLMRLAERFRLPVVTFVDTPGAYPGVGAEERGQSEAIARAIDCCLDLRVPFVACIVGEGGSGGAVALAAANRVVMFEHAVYSVISPEGCAAILWNAAERAQEAAEALKLTAADLLRLKVIDEVVAEPPGGAQRNPHAATAALGDAIDRHLRALAPMEGGQLRESRRRKFLDMGRGAV
jgi:acetyl-CoA carboxylase carboxyl transferase subunit alpha